MIFPKIFNFSFFIKYFLLFFGACCFFLSCDNNEKLIAYLKSKKEVIKKIGSIDEQVKEISFLFFIDTSGSMKDHKPILAENIELFLKPLFEEYPDYNYNFGVISMSPLDAPYPVGGRGHLEDHVVIKEDKIMYVSPNISDCGDGYKTYVQFEKTDHGAYIRYLGRDIEEKSIENIICPISQNIIDVQGDSGTEPYFELLDFILDNVDEEDETLSAFFGKDKFLVLFFLSDADYTNDKDFNLFQASYPSLKEASDIYAQEKLKKLQTVVSRENIRIYSVVPDKRKGQHERREGCSIEGGFPEHLYSLLDLVGGQINSVCNPLWGQELVHVFDELKVALPSDSIFLDEVPDPKTIEVFFNDTKLPQDVRSGWYFDPESISIHIGKEILVENLEERRGNAKLDNEYIIRYNPINEGLLKEIYK